MDSLPDYVLNPTLASSAEKEIRDLKRRLVVELFLRRGLFWDAVRGVRAEWGITARRTLPSEEDPGTYYPAEQAPDKPTSRGEVKASLAFEERWRAALRPLREGFVSEKLQRWVFWDHFLGACVMCDPPDDRLLEFAEFSRPHPLVFWPVTTREAEDVDLDGLDSMIAPPVERVFESREEADPVVTHRIVTDEGATSDDVKNVLRGVKAAKGFRNVGGAPPMDRAVSLQCAIVYDCHNGTDPEDGRRKRWSYKRLAEEFGLPSARSAKAHVELGRRILEKS